MNPIIWNLVLLNIAKQKLKTERGIVETPKGLLTGLILPGLKAPVLQQFVLNNAVVDEAIAKKDRELADQKSSDLKTGIDEFTVKVLPSTSQAELIVIINQIRSLVDLDPVPAGGTLAIAKKTP